MAPNASDTVAVAPAPSHDFVSRVMAIPALNDAVTVATKVYVEAKVIIYYLKLIE